MNIPKQIKIGGLTWSVIHSADVSVEGSCYGSSHHISQKIFLDPTNTTQKNEETFIHELLHGIWHHAGMGKRSDIKAYEEEIVHALTCGLYQVLNDAKLLK